MAAVLLLAYGITWAVGVPTVTSQVPMEEIATSKTLERRHPGRSWQEFPVTRTRVALPLVPGFVVAFHESAIAPNEGWGGWVFIAWWGTGLTQLGTAWPWMS